MQEIDEKLKTARTLHEQKIIDEVASFSDSMAHEFAVREGIEEDIDPFHLVSSNDPILKKETEPFLFNKITGGYTPVEFAVRMAKTMMVKNGYGLAAPQVGFPYSVFVVGNPKDKESIMAFFNPKIVDEFGEDVSVEEGCLSFPGLFIKIKRKSGVRLRFTDMYGDTNTRRFTGFSARVILHEMDHLNGILFQKRSNRAHLERAKRQKKKLDKIRKSNE